MENQYLSSIKIIMVISLLMIACDNNSVTNAPNSSLEISVANSLPYQFSQRFGSNHVAETEVTINQIAIRSVIDQKFIVLTKEPQSFNLFELTNGNVEEITKIDIAPGLFDQLRIQISKAVLTFDNGQSFELTIPENAKKGFVMDISPNFEIESGNTGKLSVNFNVAESFVTDGESGTFVLNPKANVVDKKTSGLLTGQILNGNVTGDQEQPLDGVRIWLTENGRIVTGTNTNEVNTFTLNGLKNGAYTLQASKPGFDTAKIENLSIVPGKEINREIILTKSENAVNNQNQNMNIRINEVGTTVDFEGSSKWVEFYNFGDTEIDLSQYWLCFEPNYSRIGSLAVLAGNENRIIQPGEFLVVEWTTLGTTEGEVGLYREGANSSTDFNFFGDSGNIIDYMQYGADGNGRDDVADQAGIWIEGEFIPTVAMDESYSFFEEEAATSRVQNWWPGIPTPGEANREE